MIDLLKYFAQGLKNTVLLKNNAGISHNGPWIQLYNDTLLDRWHVGDISSAEYTISVDLGNSREIIKCLVTASIDNASIAIYSRSNTQGKLVDISATVNQSYVDIILNPLDTDDISSASAKVIFTPEYFYAQSPLLDN